MSLIEQAAKRLEELRRAGAETSVSPITQGAPSAPSTPEAVVRALEARRELQMEPADAGAHGPTLRSAYAEELPSTPQAAPRVAPPPGARKSTRTSRQCEIDLERLKSRGFVTPDAPKTQVADEFRVIKRPIIRNAQGLEGAKVRNGNLVMVTSALPGEGKTFTALNLAMSVAMEYDHTVLLVDGDVANPTLPRLVGIPEAPGLLDLLTDEQLDVADALIKTNVEKLTVLPAGSPHRRATELLASAQMISLLRELASRYADRIVIFDSPPLLATTEARVMASHMGQILMVVAAESTSRNTLDQGLATIESCEVVLMMLNKANPTAAGSYGYYPTHGDR